MRQEADVRIPAPAIPAGTAWPDAVRTLAVFAGVCGDADRAAAGVGRAVYHPGGRAAYAAAQRRRRRALRRAMLRTVRHAGPGQAS